MQILQEQISVHAVLTQPIVCFIDLLKTESHELHPPLAFAGQHAYRTGFNTFAGNNHIFEMALFFTAISTTTFGTNSLAVILYCLNMPTVTLRLTKLFTVVLNVVGF